MSPYFLGIDTSNYKTSIALIGDKGEILFERSEFLDVPMGQRGLRQSDSFFKHSNLLPLFIDEVFNKFNPSQVSSIGVSSRPRNVEGSYMPCFLAGLNAAKEIASSLRIPVYEYSHQEGHASAILEDPEIESINLDKCLLFHLSGGTTEFLICEQTGNGYDMKLIGGTKDISIGQLLDRIGVALGYQFPAGERLDNIALNSFKNQSSSATKTNSLIKLKVNLTEGEFNLSGPETKIMRLLEDSDSENIEMIIVSIFDYISELIYESAVYASEKYNIKDIVMSGGVASSKYIRDRIESLNHDNSINILFGSRKFSGDNAVGVARLAKRSYRRMHETGNSFSNK